MRFIAILFLFISFCSFGQSPEYIAKNKDFILQVDQMAEWIKTNNCELIYVDAIEDNFFTKKQKAHIAERKIAELSVQIKQSIHLEGWSAQLSQNIFNKNLAQFKTILSQLTPAQKEETRILIIQEIDKKENEGKHDHDHDPTIKYPPNQVPIKAAGDQCTNPDFESCDFTNWNLTVGAVSTAQGPYSFINPFATTTYGTMSTLVNNQNEHNIVTGGTDPNSGLPMVFPGGSCTALLGDGDSGGSDASRISQTFQVDAFSSNLTMNYHVVMEDPSHPIAAQPYFRIRVTDSSGTEITCASYEAFSGDGQPGWTPYGSNILYPTGYFLPWTAVILPLTPYIGQNVTIEVTAGDCSYGAHSGYAYVDFDCSPLQFAIQGTAPCYGPYSLFVPPGAVSYLWSNGATTEAVVLPNIGFYSVTIIPITGSQCSITVDTLITGWPPFITPATLSDSMICIGDPVTIYTDTADVDFVHDWILPNGSTVTANSIHIASTVPSDAGMYYLTTTDTVSGCIAMDSVELFIDLGSPITTIDDTICQGDSILLTVNGTPTQTYIWDNGLGAGQTQNVSPAATTNYVVEGITPGGCSSFDTASIFVHPYPPLATLQDSSICIGATIQIWATGALTYAWNNGLPNTSTHTLSPTNTTTYNVVGTDINGCTQDDSIIVTVNPLPTVTATANQTVCEGTTVNLAGAGADTYIWDNGVIDTVSFMQTPSTITYNVMGTDLNGCQNTAQSTIIVHPNPIISATDVIICPNDIITIPVTGANTYFWDNGLGAGSSQTVSPLSNITYTIIGTDLNGCLDTTQVSVTVLPLPPVYAGPDAIICQNDSILLSGQGAVSYTWSPTFINGNYFTPFQTGDHIVTGTDANGCTNQDTMTITHEPLPTVSFIADTVLGCAPFTVNFTNNTMGNLANCAWTFSNGATTNGCSNVNMTFPLAGTFDVGLEVTSVNGCVSSQTLVNYIHVEPFPVASFLYSPTDLLSIEPVVEFQNTSSFATTYLWDFDDNSANSTEFNPTHDFPYEQTGAYEVILYASNYLGCTDEVMQVVKVLDVVLLFVPNTFTPDGDQYNQLFRPEVVSGIDPLDVKLTIYNRWGELIFQTEDMENGWDGTYGGKLAQSGIYTWKLDYLLNDSDERRIETGHVNLMR